MTDTDMEPMIMISKRISWLEASDLGLTPDEIRHTWGWWYETCKKYRDLSIHFYPDHALVYLASRNGQQIHPVFIPYSRIWLRKRDGKFFLILEHPIARYIYTVIKEQDLQAGNMRDLIRRIGDGKMQEELEDERRGFSYNQYDF